MTGFEPSTSVLWYWKRLLLQLLRNHYLVIENA